MELKTLLRLASGHKFLIMGSVVAGIILSLVFYKLPHKYSATGTFFISRTTDAATKDFFTYEGYYSQQTALSYTSTVIALLGSTDVKSKALTGLGVQVTEQSLRNFTRNMQAKKAGPQIVSFTVKDISPEYAESLWNETSKVLISTATEINKNGDPNLHISTLLEKPVIKEPYKPLSLYIAGGLVFGLIFAGVYISLKEYLS